MQTFSYTVNDELGIHARPAGLLVKLAKGYTSKCMIYKGDKSADLARLMVLMGLGVRCGDEVRIEVEGEDEEQAFKAIQEFFSANL